jgi:bacterioferritin-associated ferredoxin
MSQLDNKDLFFTQMETKTKGVKIGSNCALCREQARNRILSASMRE